MNAKIENNPGSTVDTLKIVAAALLLVAGIVGFYWFRDVSAPIRGIAMIGVIALSMALVYFTALGQKTKEFLSESQFELRKVVWPTRQETMQTTVVILIVVFILSI